MARVNKIYCNECGDLAIITKSEKITENFSRLYCACKNPYCGARWVLNMEFSHMLQASRLTEKRLVSFLLNKIPQNDLRQLKNQIEQQLSLI